MEAGMQMADIRPYYVTYMTAVIWLSRKETLGLITTQEAMFTIATREFSKCRQKYSLLMHED